MRLPRALPLALALAAACGGRSRPGTSGPPVSGDVILSDELRRVQASDLWTALQHLRPNWFRRSPSLVHGQGDLLVVVDRVPQGGSDALRQIPLGAVLRSEEHTSELQSLAYLVCRLLLEKKKK